MASKKATKRVSKLHKGKKLEEQKPLTEISLNFTKIQQQYKQQGPD